MSINNTDRGQIEVRQRLDRDTTVDVTLMSPVNDTEALVRVVNKQIDRLDTALKKTEKEAEVEDKEVIEDVDAEPADVM